MSASATIIGTGNTAWHVARVLTDHEWKINELVGRDETKLAMFSPFAIDSIRTRVGELQAISNICFLCVPDSAIAEVASAIPVQIRNSSILVHMSGTTPMNVLSGISIKYGCLWPIQTLVAGHVLEAKEIPMVVMASDDGVKELLLTTASLFGVVYPIDSEEQKQKFHLSAVMTGNFIFSLLVSAKKYCDQENLDFTILAPLIKQSITNGLQQPFAENQTGPAARGDMETMNRHKLLLADYPEILSVYNVLTETIQKNNQANENHR